MGKQNRCQTLVSFRIIVLQPEDLGSGESHRNLVADRFKDRLLSTGTAGDGGALTGGFRITPELRRPDHLSMSIEGNHAMLLTGHTDCPHFRGAHMAGGKQVREHLFTGLNPGIRVLFPATPLIFNEFVAMVAFTNQLSRLSAQEHPLGALGSTVNTYVQLISHHHLPSVGWKIQIKLLIRFSRYSCLPLGT